MLEKFHPGEGGTAFGVVLVLVCQRYLVGLIDPVEFCCGNVSVVVECQQCSFGLEIG